MAASVKMSNVGFSYHFPASGYSVDLNEVLRLLKEHIVQSCSNGKSPELCAQMCKTACENYLKGCSDKNEGLETLKAAIKPAVGSSLFLMQVEQEDFTEALFEMLDKL